MTFKEGDVVQLKSGSCPMTVEAIATNGTIKVRWYAPDRDKDGQPFPFWAPEGLPAVVFEKITLKKKVKA